MAVPTRVPTRSSDPWRGAVASNRRRTVALAVGPAVVVAAVVVVATLAALPIVIGIILAGIVVVYGVTVWWGASWEVLRRLGSVPADEDHYARLHNLVEGVCLASGLPKPELRVIEDAAPNALSVGRSPTDAVVICTTGLLDLLDRIELEAVVAHELAHIRRRDTLSGCVSVVTAGYLGLFIPTLRRLAVRGAGSGREALADQAAASLTRYPPGLISALEKIATAPSNIPSTLSPATVKSTEHLWLAPLDTTMLEGRAIRGALDLPDRIALLREL